MKHYGKLMQLCSYTGSYSQLRRTTRDLDV